MIDSPFRWVFGAVFGAEFGAEFGGFPNPPPLSINISRCDNYCCFPYHLKRITNSYTHSSVDCNCFSLWPATVGSTEHPPQRVSPNICCVGAQSNILKVYFPVLIFSTMKKYGITTPISRCLYFLSSRLHVEIPDLSSIRTTYKILSFYLYALR